jgi:hypothetical protein
MNYLLALILSILLYIIYLVLENNCILDSYMYASVKPPSRSLVQDDSYFRPPEPLKHDSALTSAVSKYFNSAKLSSKDLLLSRTQELKKYKKNLLNKFHPMANPELDKKLDKLLTENIYLIASLYRAYEKIDLSKKYLFADYLYSNSREIGSLLDLVLGNYDKYYLHLITKHIEELIYELNM